MSARPGIAHRLAQGGLAVLAAGLLPGTPPAEAVPAHAAEPSAVLRQLARHAGGPNPYMAQIDFPAVSGVPGATRIDRQIEQDATAALASFIRQLRDAGHAGRAGISTLRITTTTDALSRSVVSFTESADWFPAGAAHGIDSAAGENFDARTGRRLRLSDLFVRGANYLDVLSQQSRELLAPVIGKRLVVPSTLDAGTAPRAANFSDWSITPFGLELGFGDYQVASYAAGTPSIIIAPGRLGGALRRFGPLEQAEHAGPIRTPLLSATVAPRAPECDTPLRNSAATPTPLFCRTGVFNVEAWDAYELAGSSLLRIGPNAPATVIDEAACRDLARYGAWDATFVAKAERLAATYYGWRYRAPPPGALRASCGGRS